MNLVTGFLVLVTKNRSGSRYSKARRQGLSQASVLGRVGMVNEKGDDESGGAIGLTRPPSAT